MPPNSSFWFIRYQWDISLRNQAEAKHRRRKAEKKSSRFSFHQRSWTDIEKLWRGKVREPPNIEAMIKPKSSFGEVDKTPTNSTKGTIPRYPEHGPSSIGNSPSVTRKARGA